jgi:CheY-like chemotaxis protein
MIERAADRGAAVTRRLLAFSRRGGLRSEAVDTHALLTGLEEVMIHTLGAGVQVKVSADIDTPPLLADKAQLETVLLNLAINARDAMPNGGALVIGAAAEDVAPLPPHPAELRPGQYVRLDVSDTGAGMSPEVLTRATEPFFTTKPDGQGTGLGLAMARDFAEQSGGALTIQSAAGRGTMVSLWLPLAAGQETTKPQRVESRVSRAVILLVDDENLVREALAESLEARGYSVLQAQDGASALAVLDVGARVELLLTDLAMPGMDGRALIEAARRHRPGLAVALLTGYAADEWTPTSSGPFALLHKPVGVETLLTEVERLTAEQSRAEEPVSSETAETSVIDPTLSEALDYVKPEDLPPSQAKE